MWDLYWYGKNLQGDVTAVYRNDGLYIYGYYSAFGDTYEDDFMFYADFNPFRYRGYYYDSDLGMYYLNSRYYDTNTCRFINADGYVSTGTGLLGYNMYAYCNNNPVMYVDPTGECYFDAYGNWRHDNWEYSCGYERRNVQVKERYETDVGIVIIVDGKEISEEESRFYSSLYRDLFIIRDMRACNGTHDGDCNPDIQVVNSYRLKTDSEKMVILNIIYDYDKANPSTHTWGRSIDSMLVEWDAHNSLRHLSRNPRLISVDFDAKSEDWTIIDYCKYAWKEFVDG